MSDSEALQQTQTRPHVSGDLFSHTTVDIAAKFMPICQIHSMLPCVCSVTDQIPDGFRMWQQKNRPKNYGVFQI